MVKQVYITIHHALYSDATVVTLDGIDYPIQKASNGCRYVDYKGTRIMQQNRYKDSKWAKQARAGKQISWAMTQPTWIRIDEETINPPKTTANDTGGQTQPTHPANPGKTISGPNNRRSGRNFWRG